MALQLRLRRKSVPNPSFLHFFSSSSSTSDPNATTNPIDTSDDPASRPKSPSSSYFSDVKASLKLKQQQQQPPTSQPPRRPSLSFSTPLNTPSKMPSFEEIQKDLSEFRRRSAPPSPSGPSSQPISFQELYKRNMVAKPEETSAAEMPGKGSVGSGKVSFDTIRESLRQLTVHKVDGKGSDPLLMSGFRKNLRLQPVDLNTNGNESTRVIGSGLPESLFMKEMGEKKESEGSGSEAMKTEFVKMYNYGELGEKLKMLRPEKKGQGENWFSLEELNERLVKLREVDEKETKSGVTFKELRDSLLKLKMSDEENARKSTSK